jgi:hypothetical protein
MYPPNETFSNHANFFDSFNVDCVKSESLGSKMGAAFSGITKLSIPACASQTRTTKHKAIINFMFAKCIFIIMPMLTIQSCTHKKTLPLMQCFFNVTKILTLPYQ